MFSTKQQFEMISPRNIIFTNKLWILVGIVSTLMITLHSVDSYPLNLPNERKHPITLEIENPEEVLSVLDNLMQNILVGIDYSHSSGNFLHHDKNAKRGIDLGLSRGFSGSQAAKHLMGMSAASFANGPGRRRK